MPFLDEKTTTGSGTPSKAFVPLNINMPDRNFFTEVIPDAFSMENTVGSLSHYNRPIGEWEQNYDFISDMPEEHAEDYMGRYSKANNREDLIRIRGNIERELETRQRLEDDGAEGFVGMLAAGILDPINLIGFGGAAKAAYFTGKTALRLTGRTAAVAGGSTVISETALQSTQSTRTLLESSLNIAGATVLGGLLGGSVGSLKYFKHAKKSDVEKAILGVEHDMNDAPPVPSAPRGGGAQAVKGLPGEAYDAIEASIEADIKSGKIVEGQRLDMFAERVRDELLHRKSLRADTRYLKAAAATIFHQDPTGRLTQSPALASKSVREKLAEIAVETAENELGTASVVPVSRLIEGWQAPLYNSLKKTDDLYVQYVIGKNKAFGSIAKIALQRGMGMHKNKMTYKEFREAVGISMRNGDESAEPLVANAAKMWRKDVYEPLKEAAIAEGLLGKDVSIETAISYLNRVYRKDLINANRTRADGTGFVDLTVKWLQSNQKEAAIRNEKYDSEIGDLRSQASGLRGNIKETTEAIKKSLAPIIKQRTEEAIDEALERMDVDDLAEALGKKPEEIAKLAATKAGKKKLIKLLSEEIGEQVKDRMDDLADDAIEAAITKFADGDMEAATALKSFIAEPLPRAGGKTAVKALDAETLSRIADEVSNTFDEAFDASLAKQMKKASSAADGAKVVKAKAMKTVYKETNAAVRAAVKEATKAMTEELNEIVGKVAERQRVNRKDLFDMDLAEYELKDIAGSIADKVTGAGGRTSYDYDYTADVNRVMGKRKTGLSAPLRARSYTIGDSVIQEYLENDIEVLSRMLTRSLAPDIELKKAFGDINMESAINDINNEWKAIGERRDLDPSDKSNWTKQRDRDVTDVEGLRDRLRGVYALPENPSDWVHRTGVAMRHLNYLRLLGGMTISAIPDIARLVFSGGLSGVWGDLIKPLVSDFNSFALRASELRSMGLATDMIMNSRAQRLADIGDETLGTSIPERILGAAADTFGTASLMSPWNTVLKQLAGSISHSKFIRLMRKDLDGTISKKDLGYLRSNFIGRDESELIMAQIDKHGATSEQGLEFSHADMWDSGAGNMYDVFKSALARETDKTIVTPGQDKPLMASTTMGRLLFQFKTFALASTQRMLIAGLQQRDAAVLLGLTTGIGLGTLSYMIKEKLAGREINMDVANLIRQGVDRSGVTAWLFEAHNIVERGSQGAIGLSRLGAGDMPSRYAAKNTAGALAGPSGGLIADVLDVGGSMVAAGTGHSQWSYSDTKRFRRLMPYQNLSYIRQLLDHVQDATDDLIAY